LLTRLVPPSCLGVKCVYRTRVVSSAALALRLLVSTELSASRLRAMGVDHELGRKLPVLLRRAALQVLESMPAGNVYEVALSILSPLPRKVREHAARRFAEVAGAPLSYIEARIGNLKMETGWRVIGNPLKSLDAFIIPKRYMWFTLEYLTSVETNFKPELVFCGDWECYPLPLALFPSRRLTGLAYDTGHIEPIIELERKYGGANIAVVINRMYDEIREAAVAIHPRRRRTRVALFMKVDNPREVALRLAGMQAEALEVQDELLKRVLGEEYMEIFSGEDLRWAIEEALEEELELE